MVMCPFTLSLQFSSSSVLLHKFSVHRLTIIDIIYLIAMQSPSPLSLKTTIRPQDYITCVQYSEHSADAKMIVVWHWYKCIRHSSRA